MVLRFSGFELDRVRAELRGADGQAIKLRPKTFAMLSLFAAHAGRVLSKQELMDAVWPNVHVGDDSLFQCIKELRTALGDDQRQIVKLVSGRGYLFEAEVKSNEPSLAEPPSAPPADIPPAADIPAAPGQRKLSRRSLVLAAAGIGAFAALLLFSLRLMPDLIARGAPTIAVMPIIAIDGDIAAMAGNVTTRLSDGLARIENIRVEAPLPAQRSPRGNTADFVVTGELQKTERSWEVRARMTRTATGEVVWTAPLSVPIDEPDLDIQQSRVTAAIGHPLALRLSALLSAAQPASAGGLPPGSAQVAIEQATASIVQTSRERFETSQTLLEKALAGDPDNVELAVALAALQMRAVQMVWYNAADKEAAEKRARATLERALRSRPGSIPALEAYCRFLNATNEFIESLVACARTLSFDPWNGVGLYHIGLAQMQLGRFDDALATFKQADRFDTPQVSRWTWRLGVGMMYVLTGKSEEALPWLQSAIAITPASGRSYMLMAAAYQQMGHAFMTASREIIMKAAVLKAFGEPLSIESVDDPVLGTGEVIVDVFATRVLSYADEVFSGARKYLLTLPAIPGPGAIGRVRAFGPDATHLAVGDWVYCDPTFRSRDDVLSPDITLQGWSARDEGGLKLQKHFHYGSWAEQTRVPTENAIRIGNIDAADAAQWCALGTLLVPYGGWLAADLKAGETVLVSGATGNFGSAAVAVALAMGAGCVVAAGRNETVLADLVQRYGPRVRPFKLSGVEDDDREGMKLAAPGPIDCVFDILPPGVSPNVVRAAIMAVRPYGRVVLMGGVGMSGGPGLELPYPWIMRSCITIHGAWMYPPDATIRLVGLVRAGLLRLEEFESTIFDLDHANEAVAYAAANAGSFKMTILQP